MDWIAACRWPVGVAAVAGSIAWVTTDLLAWPRELFLVPYVAAACVLGFGFVHGQAGDVRTAIGRYPLRTAIVTVVVACLMIGTVLLQPGAPRASGAQLVFEIGWDGLAYGAVDGLLLTVIPMAAVARARAKPGWATDVLAFAASLFVFVAYHLGFSEFRGSGLMAPVAASVLFGSAYLASRNPLSPILAHVAMHVAAVLQGPAGTVQLPPHY